METKHTTKKVYVSAADAKVWADAQRMSRESMSRFVIEALAFYMAHLKVNQARIAAERSTTSKAREMEASKHEPKTT